MTTINRRKFILISVVIFSLTTMLGVGQKLFAEHYQVIHLRIATGSKSGEAYPFAKALEKVIAQHYPKIELEVIESKGSVENMQLLAQKKVELAIIGSDIPAPPSARAITILYPEIFHLIVSEKSGIQNMSDLLGKRIALMPKGSGSYNGFWVLAKHYNLNHNNFQYITINPEQALLAFRQNKVDAVVRMLPVGNQWTKGLIDNTPTRMLAIDQAAAIRIFSPYFTESKIPKGTYKANPPVPDRNLDLIGVETALVTHKDVPVTIIRELTAIIYEYRHDLVKIQPNATEIKKPDLGQNVSLPIHPGAKAYYEREKPDFISSNANLLTLIISVISLFASWFWSWRSQLLAKQKNRVDIYNLQVLELIEKARHTADLWELGNIEQQLFQILSQVVEDLDLDRIDPKSFQSFTFTWGIAIKTIQYREVVSLNLPNKAIIS